MYQTPETAPDDVLSCEYYANLFYNDTVEHNFAVLKLHVNPEFPELVSLYTSHIKKHNEQMLTTNYPNSGFDLFFPESEVFSNAFETKFVNLQVKGEMIYTDLTMNRIQNHCENIHFLGERKAIGGVCSTTGYYMYPRSSISKTPLMLANHTGIIDSGYRGNLISAVRYLPASTVSYTVEKETRLFQICHPTLCPIYVVMVDERQLTLTERGEGGFGSTGV